MAEVTPPTNPEPAPRPAPAPRIVPSPVRPRYSPQEVSKRKNQGIIGQISTLIFQPGLFFFTLPATRQWVLIAMVAVLLTGYSAIRKTETSTANGGDSGVLQPDISFDGGFTGFEDPFGGGGGGGDPFEVPLPNDGGIITDGGSSGASGDINSQLSIAVTSGAWVVMAWGLQAIVFGLATILNLRAPNWGKNLQVAVWASVPLIIMVAIQLVFHSLGGRGQGAGLSLVATVWQDFATLSSEQQLLLYSALTQTTLFALWHLSLVYTGAREALQGKRIASLLVVLVWAFIAVTLPILLGRVTLPMNLVLGGMPQ
jgi:hypothetical protein